MKSIKIIFLLGIFCSTLGVGQVMAQPVSSLQVDKILIKGNKIVEKKAIRSKITTRVNRPYRAWRVRQDVQKIFNTGWFYYIEVQKKVKEGKVNLIYVVKEKPIVEKIVYKGNDNLSKKELDEIFSFSPYEFVNHKKAKEAVQSIKEEYEKKGYYLAEVSYSFKTSASQKEKAELIIHIKENQKVKVKRLRFVGNQSLSAQEIKAFMATKETGLLSFLSSSGSYSKDILEQDLNNIRFIYMDRGYWRVFVGQPQLFISPDKTELSIHIPIQEGKQFKAGTVDFAGDLIFDKEELREGMETEEGEIFSYGKMQRDIKRLETKYGDKGYGFANVIPRFFNPPGEGEPVIHVLFEIQKGKKVKIGRIFITGNSYTRDKVIRREMRIFEGELYNKTNKDRSMANIRRLGFFDDVKIIPKTIKNRDDLMDMEVNIKERENTGTLEVGAGYDGFYGLSFTGKVHRFNLFGRGYNLGVDTSLNKHRQYVNLDFSDPYFLDSRWYFGGMFYLDYWKRLNFSEELFKACDEWDKLKLKKGGVLTEKENSSNKSKCLASFPSTNYRGFTERKISGGLTFGRSITDTLKLLFYYRVEHVDLNNTIDEGPYPIAEASGFRNPAEAIVEYDKRNDRLYPTKGIYSRNSISYDGVFSKFNYLTFSLNTRVYYPLFWKLVFRANVQYSQHLGLGKDGFVPFDRLFLLGGINSLRGFEYFAIGPRKKSDFIYEKAIRYGHPYPEEVSQRIFGGLREFYTNLELQFPIFPTAQLLGVLFMDLGSAYNSWDTFDLRANWGFGLRVFTPLGPIRLELGLPFEPRSEWGEQSSEFQFTIGLPF